ncbi:MAG: 50S ribosomal protein L33 [Elusimicrobia bacterium GWB2_63_16]|jgi:large subunit ribosomal protein L33|nr:MAG: 50S ribosomal protein L33 [Elusimicrobia bacterium GWB2_63_16]
MGDRIHITLGCTVCKNKNYHMARGKKKEFKIELNKFCRACGKQTAHKEVKS